MKIHLKIAADIPWWVTQDKAYSSYCPNCNTLHNEKKYGNYCSLQCLNENNGHKNN
jgi:hypothetical protein